MEANRSLRILGVAVADVSDYRADRPSGKWSSFFGAVADRFDFAGVVRPTLSRRQRFEVSSRQLRREPGQWPPRAGFSQEIFAQRSHAVQEALDTPVADFDLILQLQTLCAPGTASEPPAYAIYTDNTMALTQRFYRPWAPLSPVAAREWMAREIEVCRSARAVFTPSEFARRSMIEDYGCHPESVVVVGGGTNQQIERPPASDPDRPPTALFVGMDFARKGGHVLLEAWPMVRRQIPDARLVIAGPRRDPGVAALPGATWVGRVGRDVLTNLYANAHVFVLPSLFEPWGLAFFEAMGHGLPCIGTDRCAMPEIIDDQVTGRVVAAGRPRPLADALIALLQAPETAATMGRAAHAGVVRSHGWSDVAERIARHLDVDARVLAPV